MHIYICRYLKIEDKKMLKLLNMFRNNEYIIKYLN